GARGRARGRARVALPRAAPRAHLELRAPRPARRAAVARHRARARVAGGRPVRVAPAGRRSAAGRRLVALGPRRVRPRGRRPRPGARVPCPAGVDRSLVPREERRRRVGRERPLVPAPLELRAPGGGGAAVARRTAGDPYRERPRGERGAGRARRRGAPARADPRRGRRDHAPCLERLRHGPTRARLPRRVPVRARGDGALPVHGPRRARRRCAPGLAARARVRRSVLLHRPRAAPALHRGDRAHRPGPARRPAAARPRAPALLALLVAPWLAYVVAMDPLFGAFADWDLFSYGAAATSLLGAYAFVAWGRAAPRAFGWLLGLALAAASVHLLARWNALDV